MVRIEAQMSAAGKRVGVVVSRWNELVTKELLEGALETLRAHGDPEVVLVQVPGTWEIPPVAKALIERRECHGVVALGCILQGATTHAALLAGDVSGALMNLQTSSGRPITWGILTPENQEQALERTGMKLGHKGREAAGALVEMMSLLDQI
ncbi:MAG: 6,7-dimethyl-8-ribityllumazine synthase [Chthonomonas sp.]|nr:6,7-dimethyl-8-ribityllumazine synthase [Chthonomonas sp.]